MRDLVISNSEMSTIQDCRRRWYLSYHLGMTKRTTSPTGLDRLGTRVHTALELHYGSGLTDPQTLQVLKLIYDDAITECQAASDEDGISKLHKEHDLALVMIRGYLDWINETGADEDVEVISAEHDVIVPSQVTDVRFRAKLDMKIRRRSDGAIMFMDHKTTGSFDMIQQTLFLNSQARFYSLLDAMIASGTGTWYRTDGGIFNMIRRSKRTMTAKPPFYRREEIRFNTDVLKATEIKSNAVATQIRDATRGLESGSVNYLEMYPTPTRDCTWKCQFVSICSLMDDGSRWQAALEADYVQHDPYEYYTGTDVASYTERIRKGTK